MARIYISYGRQDQKDALSLAEVLRSAGQEVIIDVALLAPGENWRASLSEALSTADVVVFLITESSESSKWVMSEVGAARAYQQTRGDILIIPVVLGSADLPPVLSDLQAIISVDRELRYVADQILYAIDRLTGVRAAIQVERKERQEKIEENASTYIEDALRSLGQRESRYRFTALVWYSLGFLSLVGGIAATAIFTRDALDRLSTTAEQWTLFAFLALKSLLIIGLLVGSSKYAFNLGKSYMNEALKNSDRIHAISFGKFYLRAFGEKATWDEIKEVFQHWNIAKDSSFAILDSKEFDPNFIASAIEVAKVIAGRPDGKSK